MTVVRTIAPGRMRILQLRVASCRLARTISTRIHVELAIFSVQRAHPTFETILEQKKVVHEGNNSSSESFLVDHVEREYISGLLQLKLDVYF